MCYFWCNFDNLHNLIGDLFFIGRYLLYAIITHAGVTLTSGHYLSYVHIPSDQVPGRESPRHFLSTPTRQYPGQWLECDDETVRVHDEESFLGMLQGEDGSLMGTPYVLFYHRNTPVSTWSVWQTAIDVNLYMYSNMQWLWILINRLIL